MAHRPGLTVAGAGAVFTIPLAVTLAVLAAMGACKGMERLAVNRFRVGVPPTHATLVGAKALLFGPYGMGERAPAPTAEIAFCLTCDSHTDTAEIVPAAEGLHRIL